jgi:carboxylesterase
MAQASPYFEMLGPTGEFDFYRPPSEAKAFILCLHGFGGSPYETRPAGEAFYKNGFAATCPLFPGHGIKDKKAAKKAFNQLTPQLLLEFVEEYLARKRREYKKVFVYGQSLGGIITYITASRGWADAAATTVGPIFLPKGAGAITKLLGWSNITVPMFKPPLEKGWSYEFNAAKAGKAVVQLAKMAIEAAPRITIPFFGCYSKKDFVSWRTGDYLEALSRTHPNFSIKWFPNSGHVMLLDHLGPQITQALVDFFLQI